MPPGGKSGKTNRCTTVGNSRVHVSTIKLFLKKYNKFLVVLRRLSGHRTAFEKPIVEGSKSGIVNGLKAGALGTASGSISSMMSKTHGHGL